MFHAHRLPVGDLVRSETPNELRLEFESAWKRGKIEEEGNGGKLGLCAFFLALFLSLPDSNYLCPRLSCVRSRLTDPRKRWFLIVANGRERGFVETLRSEGPIPLRVVRLLSSLQASPVPPLPN